ncbi:unnamed protein product, partial [Bubo scandiacus]
GMGDASAIAGRKPLTGKSRSPPHPPPPPPPLNILWGDEGPPPPSGAAAAPSGTAAEGVTPSAPPKEENTSLSGDPSIPDMVAACSKVGTVEHKVAAQMAAQ